MKLQSCNIVDFIVTFCITRKSTDICVPYMGTAPASRAHNEQSSDPAPEIRGRKDFTSADDGGPFSLNNCFISIPAPAFDQEGRSEA